MPFPPSVREEALVRSSRRCCVCREFVGRAINVHHIVQEADGGPNTIENAIVLCLRCHSEAGHFNARHPIGTKYSPSELVRHRDQFWVAVADGRFHPPVADLEVTWSRATPFNGDLHTYDLKVLLRNGETSLEHWKLQVAVPCYIPIKVERLAKIKDTIRHDVRYVVHELTGGKVLPGESVELVGSGSAFFEYRMTHEIYYASTDKDWVCSWSFYSSSGLPVEGSLPWEQMHVF